MRLTVLNALHVVVTGSDPQAVAYQEPLMGIVSSRTLLSSYFMQHAGTLFLGLQQAPGGPSSCQSGSNMRSVHQSLGRLTQP